MLAKLVGADDLEVRTEPGEDAGHPLERVGAQLESRARTCRAELGNRCRHSRRDVADGRVQLHFDLPRSRQAGQHLDDMLGGVEVRVRRRGRIADGRARDAVRAKRPHLVAAAIACGDVPPASAGDKAERLDLACAAFAVAAFVVDLE